MAITDNADPMNVLAYRRAVDPKQHRLVCKEPLFEAGASATDQSLIGSGRSLIAENNYGYTIAATQAGGTSTPGSSGCRSTRSWRAVAPSGARRRSLRPWCRRRPRRRGSSTPTRSRRVGDRRSVVSHGARLRDGRDGLEAPRRRGARVQQQLRADHDRPERADLPGRARRAGGVLPGVAQLAQVRSARKSESVHQRSIRSAVPAALLDEDAIGLDAAK